MHPGHKHGDTRFIIQVYYSVQDRRCLRTADVVPAKKVMRYDQAWPFTVEIMTVWTVGQHTDHSRGESANPLVVPRLWAGCTLPLQIVTVSTEKRC